MARKRNLDEINPLDLASAINPDLAAAVAQASKRPKPEVKPARSTQRRVTDEIVARFNRQLNGEEIPKGWFTIPAAATAAGVLANPIAAVVGTAAASGASQIVDEGSKELTGKNWTENISKGFDINPTFASYTNPGVLAGGLPFTKGAKMIGNTVRGLHDAYRYGNASLQPNAFGQAVINTLSQLSGRNYRNVGANNIENLPFRRSLALPYNSTNSARNFGNVVNLPSSNNVISIPDLDVDKRRTLLKRINKIFASRYGYTSLPLAAAKTREATEEAIKGIMTQHNTFVRGVRDEAEHVAETNAKLIASGLEPTVENRLKWYATRFAGDTGHGRVGFNNQDADNLGTIYTSNMFPVAKGYASSRAPGQQGAAIVVRRPLNFSSPNLEDWVTDNEFSFVGEGRTKAGINYFKYNLPQYLKTGKTLTRQYLDEHPIIDSESYNPIANRIAKNYFGNFGENSALDRRRRLKIFADRDNIDFEFPTTYYGPNHTAAAYAEIEDNIITALSSRTIHRQAYDKMIRDFFAKHPGYYSPEYYVGGTDRVVFKDGDRTGHMITDVPRFIFDEPDFSHPDYNKELSDELNAFLKDSRGKYMADIVRGRYYGQLKNLKGIIQKSKDRLKKQTGKAISKEIARRQDDIDLDSYAKTKGVVPTTPRTVLFGDRTGKNVTKNSKDNPWQHFVFVGPVDKQGLDYVRTVPWNELLQYPNMHGGHIGKYTPGLSRKVKKFGGVINRRTLAAGGKIHINPANRGKFNATKARTGKTTEELTHSKNPLTRKRAIFAQNAAKWHH